MPGQSVLRPRGGAPGLSLISELGRLLPLAPAQKSLGLVLFWLLLGGSRPIL